MATTFVPEESTFKPEETTFKSEDFVAETIYREQDPLELASPDPSEPPDPTKPGISYPLAETLFARPLLAGLDAAVPGLRNILLASVAESDEEVKQMMEFGQSIEGAEWYKKLPEAYGYGMEKFLEYKTLGYVFKLTGIDKLLGAIGTKLSSKIVSNELASMSTKGLLLNYGGVKTLAKNVVRSTIKSLPKTTQFMGVWGGTESARRGEGFSSGYANGVKWGALLSVAAPAIVETAKFGLGTKTFEKALLKFDTTFPKIASKVRGEPSKEAVKAVFDDLKLEFEGKGIRIADELNITHLSKTGRNIVKSLARRWDVVNNKKAIQELMRKGPQNVAKVAAEKVAKEAENVIIKDASRAEKVAKGKVTKFVTKKQELNNLKKQSHKVAKEKSISDFHRQRIAEQTTGKSSAADMNKEELQTFISTMEKTDSLNNAMVSGRMTKARDSGLPIEETISSDKNIAQVQEDIIQRRTQRVSKHQKKVAKKDLGEYNYLDWFEPTRLAFADFENNTGIPVAKTAYDINVKASRASTDAESNLGKMVAGIPINQQLNRKQMQQVTNNLKALIGSVTKEENDRIGKWLFSEETRKEVIPLTNKEQKIANRLQFALQGPIAVERMEESLRFWMNYNKKPADVNKKYNAEQQKDILEGGKKAQADDNLKVYVKSLFDKNIKFGIRSDFYYQSEKQNDDAISDFFENVTATELAGPTATEAVAPSLIGGRTLPRKGNGGIKKGSVFSNIMRSYQRLMIRNSVANDLPKLYDRLNQVELSARDNIYLNELYSNVLMKGDITVPPWKFFTKMSSAWWRARLSLLNTETALNMIARNAVQTLAEGGQVLNVRKFTKNALKVSKAFASGKGLESIDVEMAEDFNNNFRSVVSQKKSIYEDAMFVELGKRAKTDKLSTQVVDFATLVLDKSGGGYVAVDEIARIFAWTGSYKTVKDAANDYLSNKINMSKFMDATSIDTMMSSAQTETAIDLLSAGKVRELSNYVANINTMDIHRGYKVPERAGVERKTQSRLFWGIYTYVRGKYDLYVKRGVKPLLEGVKDKNYGKAKRAANNVAKGLVGSWTADKILLALGFPTAYTIGKQTYNILQPVVSITAEAGKMISMIAYSYSKGDIDEKEAVKQLSNVLFNAALEFVPTPTKKIKKRLKGQDIDGGTERRSSGNRRESR